MKKNMYKLLVLFISLFLTSFISSAQEKRCITEIYSVEKSQSKSYARELEEYLKSKGLYDNKKSRETITSSIKKIYDYEEVVRVSNFNILGLCDHAELEFEYPRES